MKKERIIIDTDPGKDDVLAIMLAELSGNFDIQAVTTVAGNSTLQNVTNNARWVMDLLEAKVPIFSGTEKPLSRELVLGNVMGKSGLDGIETSIQEPLSMDASQRICEIVRQFPNEVTIVAIGPQTNIARAFRDDPAIIPMVKEVVMMAGAITVPGNKNRVAEFNIFIDPEACDIVMRAEVSKVLIPLDVCYKVPIYSKEFEEMANTRYGEAILQLMRSYIKAMERFEGQPGAIVYDALAVYYLLNPQAFTIEPMDIQIETQGELTRGMCVVETRTYIKSNPNVRVAMEVDRQKFTQDFFSILKKE